MARAYLPSALLAVFWALIGLSACAGSATLSRLRESSPIIRDCEKVRAEAAGDQGAGMVKRSGCPVCQW